MTIGLYNTPRVISYSGSYDNDCIIQKKVCFYFSTVASQNNMLSNFHNINVGKGGVGGGSEILVK